MSGPWGRRLLLAAWAVVLLTAAGVTGWLLTAGPPPPGKPSLVLVLPPPPAAEAQAPAQAEPPSETAPAQPPAPEPARAAAPVAPSGPVPAVAAPSPAPARPAATSEIAREAKRPWEANARPFAAAGDRPRIAVVVTGLGLAEGVARAAVDQLPPDVTLAFLPYAPGAADWVKRARAAGHEVLINVPMEASGSDDAGPRALSTALEPEQNLERLEWILSQASGYVGVIPTFGARFLTSEEHVRPVLADVRDRGLLFVDNGATPRSVAVALAGDLRLSRAANDRFIDSDPTPAAIDRRLREIEQIARETGAAVAVGRPYPSTIERVAEWARGLEGRGFALAPISAVVDRQPAR